MNGEVEKNELEEGPLGIRNDGGEFMIDGS